MVGNFYFTNCTALVKGQLPYLVNPPPPHWVSCDSPALTLSPLYSVIVEHAVWDPLDCSFQFNLQPNSVTWLGATSKILPIPHPHLFPCPQMWNYCQWTARRPAAGWTISCEPTRSSGKRTTAPSASAWTESRTARPWPANRAVRTLSRSPESAVLSVKVQRLVLFLQIKFAFYVYNI